MLTVKLMRTYPEFPVLGRTDENEDVKKPCRFTTKIMEVNEVDIHLHRPGELYEINVVTSDGKSLSFYVADRSKPRPKGFSNADTVDFYYAAYIENSNGATTEIVKF